MHSCHPNGMGTLLPLPPYSWSNIPFDQEHPHLPVVHLRDQRVECQVHCLDHVHYVRDHRLPVRGHAYMSVVDSRLHDGNVGRRVPVSYAGHTLKGATSFEAHRLDAVP